MPMPDSAMATEINIDTVRQAAVLALRDFAGLRAAPRPGSPPPATDDDIAVEVPFWGALHGKLMMRASGGLTRAIAAQLFHAAEPTRRQGQEALCLIAGSVCGTMLAAQRDGRRSCQLEGARIIENVRGYENLFGVSRLTAQVGCDEGSAELRVYLNTIAAATGLPPRSGGD